MNLKKQKKQRIGIQRLSGMQDYTAENCQRVRIAVETLSTHLTKKGYTNIDTPIIEETDLFVRKSGGELISRLYSFTEPGGHNVSLRPEFTSSAIRHFIEERDSLTIPVRWQYNGPVFRYAPTENGGYRQFTQIGAELVGAAGMEADTEIIGLALEGLEKIGVGKIQVRIGHLGVMHDLINSFGISDPAKLFIMSNVQDMKDGRVDASSLRKHAIDVGIVRSTPESEYGAGQPNNDEQTERLIQTFREDTNITTLGRRTPQEIETRLRRKAREADDPKVFEQAASTIIRLALLDGPYKTVLNKSKQLMSERSLKSTPLEELENLFVSLGKRNIQKSDLVLDLALARGFSYYTGIVFEMSDPSKTSAVSLGGGGRYDGLVKALGDEEDVPALGFAYNLDPLLEALNVKNPIWAKTQKKL